MKNFERFIKEDYQVLSEKSFHEIYKKKNKWIELLDAGKREEIADNLYVLIQNSYGHMGGHVSIPNILAIFDPKLYYWEAVDNNSDDDANVVLFGRKSPFGTKISGVGHDQTKKSKSLLMRKLQEQLKKPGYWIEASDRVAEILYSTKTPYVDNQQDVEKIFNQEVEWLNDNGKYNREVSTGTTSAETIFGHPKIK